MRSFVLAWMMPCLLLVGCTGAESSNEQAATDNSPAASQFVADTEPAGAIPVGVARESIEDGQEVSLVGVIGGSPQPFVEGLAAFTIVDPKIPSCADEEGCPTPWDYCCTQDQVQDNIATIKVVDASGAPVAQDAKNLLGVKELSTVVVSGTAARDEAGNLTVAANKIFVRP